MITLNILQSILNDLYNASLISMNDHKQDLSNECLRLINSNNHTQEDINKLDVLIRIGNITYNNLDTDLLPIEDGVYDLLLETYRKYNPNFQVGSIEVNFESQSLDSNNMELISPIRYMGNEEKDKIDNLLFKEIIDRDKNLTNADFMRSPLIYGNYITKRINNAQQQRPELVGTLDKCKYVLVSQAKEKGVYGKDNVKVLEEDFFGKHLKAGIIDYHNPFDIIAELKYDGVSVEADVNTSVISARTRGDTGIGVASDITPILGGYKFPNAVHLDEPIGMKFEAIMTYDNLYKFNIMKGKNYKNGRTAIIGLMGSSDAYLYRDLITLVPLATDLKDENGNPIDRLVEIEFMNKYYCNSQLLRYSIISGNYTNVLFQIKRFVEEAEFSRSYLPFMYDGVVLSYYDPNIRHILGRENFINKYSMAVKFNALKKQTIFRGYTYTVGQNGLITPMIHYDAVEFFGTIHTKSTGSSYNRFMKLNLHIGDLIDVEYVNDVMPYVDKPKNSYNDQNALENEAVEFPRICPCCSTELILIDEGSAKCPNMNCPERTIARMTNMLDKLNLKDFAEERIKLLNAKSFTDLMNLSLKDLSIMGDINAHKLKTQLDNLKVNPIEDYKIIGSLGFSDIASKTWKLIFNKISLSDFVNLYYSDKINLCNLLKSIRGIGTATTITILNEFEFFKNDIYYIMENINIISTVGKGDSQIQIRFTGFRDKDLVNLLQSKGVDADDNAGITKSTTYLLIPYANYNQGNKIAKAKKYGIKIIDVNKFRELLNTGGLGI